MTLEALQKAVDAVTRKPAALQEDTNGCWVWPRPHKQTGYGSVRVAGRQTTSSSFSYMLLVGEIPEGLCLDHLCRNRACCNPLI